MHAHHTTHTTQDGDVFTAAWGGKGKSAPATAVVGTFAKEAAVVAANGRMPASARPAAGGSLRVPLDATAAAAAWMWRPDADACASASAVGAAETWVDTDTDAEVGSDGGLWENDGD